MLVAAFLLHLSLTTLVVTINPTAALACLHLPPQ
jgi:hypothetical protein